MAWDDLPSATRARIERIFDRARGKLGTEKLPNAEGLASIAKEGKEIWNAWASCSFDCDLDFSYFEFKDSIDFSEFIFPKANGKTSFRGCKFRESANFSNSKFKQDADFEKAEFYGQTDFSGCVFEGCTAFKNCTFHEEAIFTRSKIYGEGEFYGSKFHGLVNFQQSIFYGGAQFGGSTFNSHKDFSLCEFHKDFNISRSTVLENSNFSGCTFHADSRFISAIKGSIDFSDCTFRGKFAFLKNKIGDANFSRSVFYAESHFNESIFEGEAYFSQCKFMMHTAFRGSTFCDYAKFDLSEFHRTLNFSCYLHEEEPKQSVNVKNISFSGCKFLGVANFNNRNFTAKSDFGQKITGSNGGLQTEFHKAPTFHGCKFHQDTTFHGAEFVQDYGDAAARAYRTLKLASEQLKATRDEQRFFQLEMKAEKLGLSGWKRRVSSTYELLSDYGFSLGRPLKYWLLFSLLFGGMHGVLANKATGASWIAAATPRLENVWSAETQQAFQYVAINAIPVPGLDRKSSALRETLFAPKHAPDWIASIAILLEMLHKAATLLCLFLIGLSIRNLLKMKS